MIKFNGKEVEFIEFPNRESKLVEDSVTIFSNLSHTVTFKYTEDGDLIKLLILKKYLDNVLSKNTNIYLNILYMPYSRMDRSEFGSAFTLKYISELINFMNFSGVQVIEPHSDVTPALLNYSESIFVNVDLLSRVTREVRFDKSNDIIVFPDGGAGKRYGSKFNGYKYVVGNKVRNFESGKIESLQLIGDVGTSKKAIIVDDLSSYGGTFIMTAKALKEQGVEEIYLLVAHAEESVLKGNLFASGLIDKVFTTDSIIDSDKENAKLKIYKLEEVI